mmetsp:Transcript_11444/g.22871  ORF Transcript_11444/g.22871 Transcript_11444/m.22871 type:complete len:283 (-) Transcript_11444:354-1202(-)
MRTSVAHWNTKSLGRSNNNVGSPLSWWSKLGQSQWVCGYHDLDLGIMCSLSQSLVVADGSICGWILHHDTAYILIHGKVSLAAHFNNQSKSRCSCFAYINGLRMALIGHKESRLLSSRNSTAHCHGLGSSCGFVQQRGIGHFHPGQIAHHRLEVHQRFKTTLSNFSLVWCVLRVPSWVLQQVSHNDSWEVSSMIPHSNETLQHLVLGSHLFEMLQKFRLCHTLVVLSWQRHAILALDAFWHGSFNQLLHALKPTQLSHLLGLLWRNTVMSWGKSITWLQCFH